MNALVHVRMGELEVCDDGETALETFVGSCVVLCLYDPYSKIGGMAHIMLPQSDNSKKSRDHLSPAKYADQAIENLLRMAMIKGAKMVRIRAKIAGGANMFSHEQGGSLFNIGERNVLSVKSFLKERGIPLLSEDTGMNYGRNVQLDVKSGNVIVTSKKLGKRSM